MDKYQHYLIYGSKIDNRNYNSYATVYGYARKDLVDFEKGLMDIPQSTFFLPVKGKQMLEDTITIQQDEDITFTKYTYCIKNIAIETVYAVYQDENVPFDTVTTTYGNIKDSFFYHDFDFDHRANCIKIVFKDHLADDLVIPIQFIEADKEAYYARKAAERRAQLIENASIHHATGRDLVNIYFQPCDETYHHTEIWLYVKAQKAPQFMAKYKVDKDFFFLSVDGLACSTYSYILKQFDASEKLIFETEPSEFSIAITQTTGLQRLKNHHTNGF